MNTITYKEAILAAKSAATTFCIEESPNGFSFVLDLYPVTLLRVGTEEESHMALRHRNRKHGFHLVAPNKWEYKQDKSELSIVDQFAMAGDPLGDDEG